MKSNEKIIDIIGKIILILLIVGMIIGIYFLGFFGFTELLGIKYDSIWALTIFIISVLVLGIFVEIVFEGLNTLVVRKVSNYLIAFIIQLLFGFISESIALVIVDAVMISVTLSVKTIFIMAFSLTLLGTFYDIKNKE